MEQMREQLDKLPERELRLVAASEPWPKQAIVHPQAYLPPADGFSHALNTNLWQRAKHRARAVMLTTRRTQGHVYKVKASIIACDAAPHASGLLSHR